MIILLSLHLLLLLLGTFISPSFAQSSSPTFDISQDFIPGRFIVEFSDPHSLAKRSLYSDPTHAFISLLISNGFPASPAFSYSSEQLFVGASFDASHEFQSDDEMLYHLKSLPEVKNAWPVRIIKAAAASPNSDSKQMPSLNDFPSDYSFTHGINLGPNIIKKRQLHQDITPAVQDDASIMGTFIDDQLNTTFHSDSQYHFPKWNPHSITGVDSLHARNITGKGITIGIVDSGTFFYDEALGGGFGPNYKVAGGWNIVGNVYDPTIQGFGLPNNNTLDCLGHGTHVAGIVGASNTSTNEFIGVAPEATIKSYKVFGCTESTGEDTVMAALEKAFNDDVDVINMSIGSEGGGFQDNPLGLVSDKIAQSGVFVSVSAGNGGLNGPFTGNMAGTGRLVAAVGSTSTGQLIGYEATALSSNGDSFRFAYLAPQGVQPNITGTFALTVADDTACNLQGSIESGSEGRAIIFPQGNCTGYEFYQAVQGLGYSLVLSYQSDYDLPAVAPTQYIEDSVFRLNVESSLGQWILTQSSAGSATFSIKLDDESLIPRTLMDTVANGIDSSYFTSVGPDFSGNLYPLISAPGSSIYSSWLNWTRANIDGSSMSAPYLTGVVALYLQSIGGRPTDPNGFVSSIRSRLVQTANSLKLNNG